MKPTLGRIVHYTDLFGDLWAAIVTGIDDTGRPHLAVFTGTTTMFLTSIPEGDSHPAINGCWAWPPRTGGE